MPTWTATDLDVINRTVDLYVSPLRPDGVNYGTPTNLGPGRRRAGVRARGQRPMSIWYQAAISQKAGRVRVDGHDNEVTFSEAPADVADAIDTAYEDKYPGSSAVPIMQADGRSRRPSSSAPDNHHQVDITRHQLDIEENR
jgi:hypothetical protein